VVQQGREASEDVHDNWNRQSIRWQRERRRHDDTEPGVPRWDVLAGRTQMCSGTCRL